MKLSFEQIKSITQGTVRIIPCNGKIKFLRFTEAQEKMYEAIPDFYRKTFATAGVRLEFATNSRFLTLKVDVCSASSRIYCNHDIYVNGKHSYSLGTDNFAAAGDSMILEGSYSLGEGKKTVCIYFPWSARSELISLELDNGCTVAPVEHSCKMLIFGDSITQGYDAYNPSSAYSSILTDALDASALNKGIGGEIFRRELAELAEDFYPDIITVAYGTNDWSILTKEKFDEGSANFYKIISEKYPRAKIFALAPIWRGNSETVTPVGKFTYVSEKIHEIASELPNVTVIDCIDFVPHDASMFSPDVLHPNDLGFSHYASEVASAIKKELGFD